MSKAELFKCNFVRWNQLVHWTHLPKRDVDRNADSEGPLTDCFTVFREHKMHGQEVGPMSSVQLGLEGSAAASSSSDDRRSVSSPCRHRNLLSSVRNRQSWSPSACTPTSPPPPPAPRRGAHWPPTRLVLNNAGTRAEQRTTVSVVSRRRVSVFAYTLVTPCRRTMLQLTHSSKKTSSALAGMKISTASLTFNCGWTLSRNR
jgi:hypothetical protein